MNQEIHYKKPEHGGSCHFCDKKPEYLDTDADVMMCKNHIEKKAISELWCEICGALSASMYLTDGKYGCKTCYTKACKKHMEESEYEGTLWH